MQRLGASAGDFRSEEDLHRLPVVNKSMLREDYGTAETYFLKSLEYKPDYEQARSLLAQVRRMREARADFER